MSVAVRRRSPEEVASLGAVVFERAVRPHLRPEDDGKFVALDVLSGDYLLDEDDYAAVTGLKRSHPSGEIWLTRVGEPAAYRLRRGTINLGEFPVWSPSEGSAAAEVLMRLLGEYEAKHGMTSSIRQQEREAVSTVQEIETAVQRLSQAELASFRDWFAEYNGAIWDAQIEADAKAGRLDHLAAEALLEDREGRTTER